MLNNARKLSKNEILKGMEIYDRYPYIPFWYIIKEISEKPGIAGEDLNYWFKYGYGHADKKQIMQAYDPSPEMKEIYKHMENYINREQDGLSHNTNLSTPKDFERSYKYMSLNNFEQALKERGYWRGARNFTEKYLPQEVYDGTCQEGNIAKARKFGRKAYKYVGDIIARNNMSTSDPRAIAMHGVIGGTIAKMCGKYYIQGEELGELNKAIVAKIYENKKAIGFSDSDVINFSRQLGEHLGKVLGLGSNLGGEIAEMATRWNETGGDDDGSYYDADGRKRDKYGNDITHTLVTEKHIKDAQADLERQAEQRRLAQEQAEKEMQERLAAQQAEEQRQKQLAEQQAQAEIDRQIRLEAQRQEEQARWAAENQQRQAGQQNNQAFGFATQRGPSNPTAPTGPKGPTITAANNNGYSTVINGVKYSSTDWRKSFDANNSQNQANYQNQTATNMSIPGTGNYSYNEVISYLNNISFDSGSVQSWLELNKEKFEQQGIYLNNCTPKQKKQISELYKFIHFQELSKMQKDYSIQAQKIAKPVKDYLQDAGYTATMLFSVGAVINDPIKGIPATKTAFKVYTYTSAGLETFYTFVFDDSPWNMKVIHLGKEVIATAIAGKIPVSKANKNFWAKPINKNLAKQLGVTDFDIGIANIFFEHFDNTFWSKILEQGENFIKEGK